MFAALFSWMPPALKVLVIAAVSFFGFIVVVKLVRIIIAFVSDAVALEILYTIYLGVKLCQLIYCSFSARGSQIHGT